MMIVWRKRRKIIRTVLCCVVYNSCAQRYAHVYEQFLKMAVVLGSGFVFWCICTLGLAFCVFFWFSLDYFVLVFFAFWCVRFSFFGTVPRDWLGKNVSKMTYFVSSGTWHLTSTNQSVCGIYGRPM